MVSVDMRTRLDADVVLIDPETFVSGDGSVRENAHRKVSQAPRPSSTRARR